MNNIVKQWMWFGVALMLGMFVVAGCGDGEPEEVVAPPVIPVEVEGGEEQAGAHEATGEGEHGEAEVGEHAAVETGEQAVEEEVKKAAEVVVEEVEEDELDLVNDEVVAGFDVSGEWVITISGKVDPGGTMTVEQQGNEIVGRLRYGEFSHQMEGGVEGDKFLFTINDGNGMVIEGTVTAEAMKGTWRDSLEGKGEFVGVRKK